MCMSRRNHLKSVLLHSSIHPPYPSSTAPQLRKLDWPYKTNQLFISSYFQSSSSWISPLNIGYFHKYFSPIYRKYALSKSNKPSTAIWPKNASLTEIQLMRLQYHCRSSGSSVDDPLLPVTFPEMMENVLSRVPDKHLAKHWAVWMYSNPYTITSQLETSHIAQQWL